MEDRQALSVEIAYDGTLGSIKINGVDFSQVVSEITYRHKAGEVPKLVLALNAEDVKLKSVVGSVLLKSKAADPLLESAALGT